MKKKSNIVEEEDQIWEYTIEKLSDVSTISTINFSMLENSLLDRISEFYIWWQEELPKLICNSHPVAKEFFELGAFSHFMYSDSSNTKKSLLGIGRNSNPYNLVDCEIFKFSENKSDRAKERYINVHILGNMYKNNDIVAVQIDYKIDLLRGPQKILLKPDTWLQRDLPDNIFDQVKSLLRGLIKESIKDWSFWLDNSKRYIKKFIKDIPDLKDFITVIGNSLMKGRKYWLFGASVGVIPGSTLSYFRILKPTISYSLIIEKGIYNNNSEIATYEVKTWENLKAIISNELLVLISQIK